MVVDDSVVIRRLVTQALEQDPALEVVGAASNGVLELQRIPQWNPDVITLDIEMPDMDGLEMLRLIRRDYPHLRVIMFSTLTERGAAITLEALTIGADDYVAKFSNQDSLDRSMTRLKEEMIPKIRQFFRFPGEPVFATVPSPQSIASPGGKVRPQAVVIGISTGRPAALSRILPTLPADSPLPILIVQHMPPLFTRVLAERLNVMCALHVEEAIQGSVVHGGKVMIAPGDLHLKLIRDQTTIRVSLDQSEQQNFCWPAVDVLFRSAAAIYGSAVIAVVLTGMGQDGLRGVEVLKAHGASVLTQDEESSVVWGMPGAVANAGLADLVLPLDEVIPQILRCSERR